MLDAPWNGVVFTPPTAIDIATIENAIVAQLSSQINSIEIAHYPDRLLTTGRRRIHIEDQKIKLALSYAFQHGLAGGDILYSVTSRRQLAAEQPSHCHVVIQNKNTRTSLHKADLLGSTSLPCEQSFP